MFVFGSIVDTNPEAMLKQHRETERRQLRETESMIFQKGLNCSWKDW